MECILTAAAKLELLKEPKVTKNPVLVKNLFILLEDLPGDSLEKQVAYTVALVALLGHGPVRGVVKIFNQG